MDINLFYRLPHQFSHVKDLPLRTRTKTTPTPKAYIKLKRTLEEMGDIVNLTKNIIAKCQPNVKEAQPHCKKL